jgi:hypothetical protein
MGGWPVGWVAYLQGSSNLTSPSVKTWLELSRNCVYKFRYILTSNTTSIWFRQSITWIYRTDLILVSKALNQPAPPRKGTRRCEGADLANPRWERRLVQFLELSGVGRKSDGRRDGRGWGLCREDG